MFNDSNMTANERRFAESVVNFEANVKKAQAYIKENYNVESEFDITNLQMVLKANKSELNESDQSLTMAAAKNYINEQFDEAIVCIMLSEAEEKEDKVFLVQDKDGTFIGVYNTKEEADKAKSDYEITPDMKAEIKEVSRSEFEKQ
jgi:hypothetical protein